MFKKTSQAVMGALMLGSALLPFAASAQTTVSGTSSGTGSSAVMPILYNQSGQPVNVNTTGPLSAGYYYLGTGGTQQVYYYGNGVYYNAATGMYGGSATANPNGTSGASLGYSTDLTSPSSVTTTPGVPNTGAGGDSTGTWVTLILAALVVAGGVAYLVVSRPQAEQM